MTAPSSVELQHEVQVFRRHLGAAGVPTIVAGVLARIDVDADARIGATIGCAM